MLAIEGLAAGEIGSVRGSVAELEGGDEEGVGAGDGEEEVRLGERCATRESMRAMAGGREGCSGARAAASFAADSRRVRCSSYSAWLRTSPADTASR
ncbi:MAG: hypothetical protein R3F14_18155 [Polyangiaceae bacterium]